MTEKFAPARVFIHPYAASQICDVIVSVRGQQMVVRCPDYSQAQKWARMECRSYNIPEPEIVGELDQDELPLFLRSAETTES